MNWKGEPQLSLFDPAREKITAESMSDRRHLAKRARNKGAKQRGYAWHPGTGPEGETCKTCIFREGQRNYSGNKHWSKCWLSRSRWTGGTGTDILARSPACKHWRAIPDTLKAMWSKLRKMYAAPEWDWKETSALREEATKLQAETRA